jgi:hypothetical protein
VAVDIAECPFVRIDFRKQQRHIALAIRYRPTIPSIFRLYGCRSGGHQEDGGNPFSGYVGNDGLADVRNPLGNGWTVSIYWRLDRCILASLLRRTEIHASRP